MRKLIIISLTLLSTMVFSQQSRLHIDDGSEEGDMVDEIIQGHSDTELYGKLDVYPIASLKAVIFFDNPSASLREKLSKSEVKVIERYDPMYVNDYKWNKPEIKPLIPESKNNNEQDIARVIGVLGAAALTGSLMVLTQEITPQDIANNPDIANQRRKTARGLALGGGIAFTIGITIGF